MYWLATRSGAELELRFQSRLRSLYNLWCYSRFPVGCPKIATRIRACAKFPIQNLHQRARMRGFSSRFLDNQLVQWTLANLNSLGPEPIQISEIFGLVKATAATCVIVTTPYLHSVLGSLGSLPLLHVHRTHNTAPRRSFSTLLLHLTRKT